MEWSHFLRYSKLLIETKLRIVFGFIRCDENKRHDNRLIFRIGGGAESDLVDAEVGVLGYGMYVHRMRDWPDEQAWVEN